MDRRAELGNEINEAIRHIVKLQDELRERGGSPQDRQVSQDLVIYWRLKLGALLREKFWETVRFLNPFSDDVAEEAFTDQRV